jgi:hypothetical protein
MIFGKTEVEYFCGEGWTGVMGSELLGKIGVLGQRFFEVAELSRALFSLRYSS